MNKFLITGRIVSDPNTVTTNTGNIISTVSVAVSRQYKDKQSGKYESDFFRFKSFSKIADYISQNLRTGDLVEIEANIVNNNYEKEGIKVYQNDYIIKNISKLVSAKPKTPEYGL